MALYEFDDERRAVVMHRPQTPSPWINYLSNGRLHAFVSQAGGGMCWWRSPAIFRLTRYRMHNLPADSPGFYVYVREGEGPAWSPSWRPCETPLDEWRATHRPGRTTFQAAKGGLRAELSLFVAPDYDALVWELSLSGREAAVDVFAYVELSLHEWLREVQYDCYNKHQVRTWYDDDLDALLYLYHADHLPREADAPLVFFAAHPPPASFDGDRDRFVGYYRYERNPAAVDRGRCGGSELAGGEPCAALHVPLSVPAGGEARAVFLLGVSPGALVDMAAAREDARRVLAALRAEGAVAAQARKLDGWWAGHFACFQCRLADPDVQRQINTWGPVQCVHTGRYSRAISTSATGVRGVGFRDTCQDMLALTGRAPDWARRELLFLLTQQFRDGHAAHTSYPEESAPPQDDLRSDDHLWPVMLAHALVAETGELGLLEERAAWLADDLSGGAAADGEGSVWEHLLAAMDFTEAHLGAHALPLTFHSDWNDIIGKFSRRGRGESVFAGQQYAYVLRLMAELADALGEPAAAERMARRRKKQLAALAEWAWDGVWWLRGFDDDGAAIGSAACEGGQVWLNPQSWAVLAGCGTEAQRRAGMDRAAERLDTHLGLKILDPSFRTYPDVADPFSGYNPGCGENGAIFCHANTWAVIAEALLGRADRAWKYYRQLIPHLALQAAGLDRYSAEPYAYVSNIVGPDNPRFGFANVTQVTGTAAWMDVAARQYLLGVRPELKGLRIDPCIPGDWRGFAVRRLYRGRVLDIRVENAGGVERGVAAIRVGGEAADLSARPVIPPAILGEGEVEILVTMGK
jgi:cellobiose phosphorylase